MPHREAYLYRAYPVPLDQLDEIHPSQAYGLFEVGLRIQDIIFLNNSG